MLGSKGGVHYQLHKGGVVRVAACRLVSTVEAEEKMSGKQKAAAEEAPKQEARQLSPNEGIELGQLDQKEEEQEVHQYGQLVLVPVLPK